MAEPARFSIVPNPLRAGFATVMLGTLSGLSGNSVMSLRIYDAGGRCVLDRAMSTVRQASGVTLDLRSIPAGVYLVRLHADGYTTQQKLVIQR